MPEHSLVTQPRRRPTRKVTAAGVGGLLATVILSLADLGDIVDMPTSLDSILTVAASFAAAYGAKAHATESGA